MVDAATQIAALRAALAAAEARADAIAAEAAHAKAVQSGAEALIAHLRLEIEKLRRELYGQRSERRQRLLEQLELQLEEMEATASEDQALAEAAAAKAKVEVAAFERRKPVRKPFPEHLPRERVVLPAPCACAACGSARLAKMGEDVTETIEVIPRQWKVIQTVREKFTCRDCERISQPPAPFHATPRGWAGPSLLAMIVFEKFGQHQPLNRQAERYAREGVELSLSTLADQVGAVAAALAPLHALIEAHVMAAGRLHGDDTTVPLLARGKTETARLWTYVRDDRPFGGPAPPAALFRFSRDRRGEHLRRDFHDVWTATQSEIAREALDRIGALHDIERAITGKPADVRLAARQSHSQPKVEAFRVWAERQLARIPGKSDLAKAFRYGLGRWPAFCLFLEDGRVAMDNNPAERALRPIGIGRKNWLFAGADTGAETLARAMTVIETAKLNGLDPQAYLADILDRIHDHKINRLDELLPWNWAPAAASRAEAA